MIESINGRLRDACRKVKEFATLDHVKEVLKAWKQDYNHRRPHGSLGHLTRSEIVSRWLRNGSETLSVSFKYFKNRTNVNNRQSRDPTGTLKTGAYG
jgi:putative transposase